MAALDISAGDHLIKDCISLAPSAFERWATAHQYDIAPAVSPAPHRVYADIEPQAAFDVWNAGAGHAARMFTESIIETDAFREKSRELAGAR